MFFLNSVLTATAEHRSIAVSGTQPRLGVSPKAIKVLRVSPCDLPLVSIRNIVSSLEHFHRVRPRGFPMAIVGGVKQLVGAAALTYVRNRGFLQFECVK